MDFGEVLKLRRTVLGVIEAFWAELVVIPGNRKVFTLLNATKS
jgi:hypothetical protein